jgi:hypothetical protein
MRREGAARTLAVAAAVAVAELLAIWFEGNPRLRKEQQ